MAVARHVAIKISQRSPFTLLITRTPLHEQADCQAPEHTENPHRIRLTHSTPIFIGRHIQALVCAALDPPVLAIGLQPLPGIHLFDRATAD